LAKLSAGSLTGVESSGREALSELTGGRIEISLCDRLREKLRAVIQLTTIQIRRVVAADDGDGVRLHILKRETGREESRRISTIVCGECERRFAVRVRLNVERLKSLTRAARRSTTACATRRAAASASRGLAGAGGCALI
jgi:hypothetical protein